MYQVGNGCKVFADLIHDVILSYIHHACMHACMHAVQKYIHLYHHHCMLEMYTCHHHHCMCISIYIHARAKREKGKEGGGEKMYV